MLLFKRSREKLRQEPVAVDEGSREMTTRQEIIDFCLAFSAAYEDSVCQGVCSIFQNIFLNMTGKIPESSGLRLFKTYGIITAKRLLSRIRPPKRASA